MQATEQLLARGGLDEISVERLSERAGVAVGSFYEYFSGKDSVLGVLIGRVTRANFEELAGKLEAGDGTTLEEEVHSFARVVVEAYLAHPVRTRVLIDGIGRLGLLRVVSDERDRFATVLAARAMRYFPGEDPRAVEATMRRAADAVMGVLGFAVVRGAPIDHDDMAAELAEMGLGIIRRRHPERNGFAADRIEGGNQG